MMRNYDDLCHTVIKNRDEKEIINNEYEDNEKGFIILILLLFQIIL